jgi:hypothetical protein
MWVTWLARKNCPKIKERLEGLKRSCLPSSILHKNKLSNQIIVDPSVIMVWLVSPPENAEHFQDQVLQLHPTLLNFNFISCPLFHYFLSRLLAWNVFKPNLSILKPQRNTAIYSMNFKNKMKDWKRR